MRSARRKLLANQDLDQHGNEDEDAPVLADVDVTFIEAVLRLEEALAGCTDCWDSGVVGVAGVDVALGVRAVVRQVPIRNATSRCEWC